MGIKPTELTYNNHCPLCFGANETPQTIILATAGIEKSPNFPGVTPVPPNGTCYMTVPGVTCEWFGSNSLFDWAAVGWYPVFSQVLVRVLGGADAFTQSVPELCERYFVNAHQNPAIFAYNYGYAVIMSQTEIAATVAAVVPYFEEGARFEVYPGPGGIIDIRYANRKHRQNIIIQLDSAEL